MRSEAPGLTFKLARIFNAEVINQLEAHYDRVVQLGGNQEEGFVREEGVSFNPRIARIASLVLEHCVSPTPEAVAAAMWSVVPDRLLELQATAPQLVSLVEGVFEESADQMITPIAATIRAVLLLDRLRHLHMATLSLSEKIAVLDAPRCAAVLAETFPISQQLRAKVQHARQLQRRNVSESM
jgi:hypothetical protein